MTAVKFEGEETFVAEAMGLARPRLDFVMDAFPASVADPVFPPRADAAGLTPKGFAPLLPLAHARLQRPGAPRVKIRFQLRVAGRFPKQTQRFLQPIAGVQRFVVFERRLRSEEHTSELQSPM